QITEENVKKVLSAAGVNPDEARIKALVAALSEINIDEVLKSATAMPLAPVAAAPAAAPSEEKKPEAKEEKKEEEKKSEEEALAGLSALFG
ncbi:MAG: 50S ribosomal protein P1, partial [Nitrososphaerota archaeon]